MVGFPTPKNFPQPHTVDPMIVLQVHEDHQTGRLVTTKEDTCSLDDGDFFSSDVQ